MSYDAAFEDGAVMRWFNGVSRSIGVHANLGRNSAFVVNFTGASRAPALEELFNFGPHPGNLAFEVGNPNLEIERTVGLDASLRTRQARAHGELNLFTYRISNFVFLDVTDEITNGLFVADYTQGDSRFTGTEGTGHVHVTDRLDLTAGLSYVRARLTDTNEALPRIPPFQGRVELGIKTGRSPSRRSWCSRRRRGASSWRNQRPPAGRRATSA